MNIQIIVGSIRENRATPLVAKWIDKTASLREGDVHYSVVDIKAFGLPQFAEAESPQGNKNRVVTGTVKDWLDTLATADGYIFVTPEYNHSVPSGLKNAIDFIDTQLMRKPVAIVSHGVMGGARANEHLRLILNSTLGGVPIPQSVTLLGGISSGTVISPEGDLQDPYTNVQPRLENLLSSIEWYTAALKTARESR